MYNLDPQNQEFTVKLEVKVEENSSTKESWEEDLPQVKIEYETIVKKEEFLDENQNTFPVKLQGKKRGRKPKKPRVKPLPGIKNVVKNYGKAMCSFATSKIAEFYLNPITSEEKISMKGFTDWVQNHKEGVDGIESLRWLLLPKSEDDPLLSSYKRSFQKISEIFMKYFCVNWIYSGKLTHTETHLHFMHKMLRRVKNPELFTYLQPHRNKPRV